MKNNIEKNYLVIGQKHLPEIKKMLRDTRTNFEKSWDSLSPSQKKMCVIAAFGTLDSQFITDVINTTAQLLKPESREKLHAGARRLATIGIELEPVYSRGLCEKRNQSTM